MNLRQPNHNLRNGHALERGSVLVIVLLIAFGLISITLYFANSMSLELRASDNRTSGMASEQIIEGAARYVSAVLSTYATNGVVPDVSEYQAEAVPVGDSKTIDENGRFWIIGRDPAGTTRSVTDPYFSLVDEASKLDLNAPWITADTLATNFPDMSYDCATAIIDWRDTNSTGATSLNYGQSGYQAKHSVFETVGELRLVFGMTLDLLAGEDLNRNGILDGNEKDLNGNGTVDPGLLEYFTVYNYQPGTNKLDGTALTNVNDQAEMSDLLVERLGAARAQTITNALYGAGAGGGGGGGRGGGGGGGGGTATTYTNLLQFYMDASQRASLTESEFEQIYDDITASSSQFVVGRVNINTAPAAVLACLPGMDLNTAQQVVNYRESNATSLYTVAWLVDALGSSSSALTTLAQSGDYITTRSYQFTADIAAVGPYGRGYRRVRFVFDLSEGTPKIIYRQDLTRLGWALGQKTRETWIATNTR